MLLESLLPTLPTTVSETLVYIVAILGIILITYGIFLETERRQDLVILLGACALLVYALFIQNIIFTLAMIGLGGASLIEFIEIYIGLHKHGPEDLKRYKHLR